MTTILSLRNIFVTALIIIGGAFMFASTRSDSPNLTADISSSEVVDQAEPKVLTSINVSPSSVRPGESVTITISTSGEIFNIIQIDAYLEGPAALNTINGPVVNIDGDGNHFGSIPIPSGAEQGTWKIKTLEVMDNEGIMTSYHYGTDIFVTFVVAQ